MSCRAPDRDAIWRRPAQSRRCGSAAAAWPLAVRAQQPTMPVIGVLSTLPEPLTARKLIDAVLEFRVSRRGADYISAVKSIRADGIRARRLIDIANKERQAALDMLAPYSRLDREKSGSLEVKLTSELVGVPGAEITGKLRIPTWLKVWWNYNVPFGGLRKTMRRMWMAGNSYTYLAAKLRRVWIAS